MRAALLGVCGAPAHRVGIRWILWTIGIILVVIALILYVLGMAGRAVGGRKHYY